jgi:tRNA(fMet)-specific endonuclease VapC
LRYLLDTNICIYSLNERPAEVVERFRATSPQDVALSVVTLLELRQGAEKSRSPAKAHRKLDLFLGPLRVLPFDEEAALRTARVRAALERAGNPIGDLDSLIAGHALACRLILVTNNEREFARVKGLRLENWVSRSSPSTSR